MQKTHVIQLLPAQYDLIQRLLEAAKADDVLPREKWKFKDGRMLGDNGIYPVILNVKETIYLDGDHPDVEICLCPLKDGQSTLVVHSENQNPERSFIEHYPERRNLSGVFDIDEYTRFEFRRAMETPTGVLIPVTAGGKPMKDAPGKYDQAARAMDTSTEHQP